MQSSNTEDTIRAFIVQEFAPDLRVEDLSVEYDLVQGGIIDSLGLLKVIAWLEDRFKMSADEIDLDPESFRSVAMIATLVEQAATTVEAG